MAGVVDESSINQFSGAAAINDGMEIYLGIPDANGNPSRKSASAIVQNKRTIRWVGEVIKGGLYILHLSATTNVGLKDVGFAGNLFKSSNDPAGITATWNTIAYNNESGLLDLDVTYTIDTSMFAVGDEVTFDNRFLAVGQFGQVYDFTNGLYVAPDTLNEIVDTVGGLEFRVVPEPASLAALGFGALALSRRKV